METAPSVTVIGGSGYIGSAIAAHCGAAGCAVTGTATDPHHPLTSTSFDFFDGDRHTPFDDDIVVFAATVERTDHPRETFEHAVTSFLQRVANTRLVYCSTDAVFGGERGLYMESDAVDPRSEYGVRTARFESLIRKHCTDYCILRPSYVYGLSPLGLDGRLQSLIASLRSDEPVSYYDDYYKSPILVTHLASIVHRVLRSTFVGTLHVAGPRTSVYEFYRRAARAFGACTRQLRPERRPDDSSLPPDTSLATDRLRRRFGYQPTGIRESLTGDTQCPFAGSPR